MTETQWTFGGESAPVGGPGNVVTLVAGSSFCLSARTGDIETGSAHGLFFLDTRFLSRFVLWIDGRPIQPLSLAAEQPFTATFFGRVAPASGAPEGTVAVFRRRFVGDGLVEKVVLRSYDTRVRHVSVSLKVHTDFADLFAVKEQRVRPSTDLTTVVGDDQLQFRRTSNGTERATLVKFSVPGAGDEQSMTWDIVLEPRVEWELCVEVTGSVGNVAVASRYRCDEPVEDSQPSRQLQVWQAAMPLIDTDHAILKDALDQTAEDLGALRIVDAVHPDDVIIAAGAPWFMTLFGRDSLLTSFMALIVDPDIALGVLRTLARLQGHLVDPVTEEEPGKILHEVRFHDRASRSFADGTIYYGSIDSSPLFVMLLGELRRWGVEPHAVDELLPHADRALAWIDQYGDRDGDGYVEYQRATPNGLANQGWKDSWDGVTFADGRLPEGPIALCEVQGYAYAAYLARTHFAIEQGDSALADHYRQKASALKEQFNRDFWLEDRGFIALALDGDKRPVDAITSNMGHCLWSGILEEDKAARVAAHLMSPELFSGWGVRTLATSMAAYNPLSYHNGSVWPHDNAIIAAGLARYGYVNEAHRIIEAVLDVSAHNEGRLPELFSGISRDELPVPAVYPTSCSPQAWAAAAPLAFLRTLLRFDPWMPHRTLWVAPELPDSMSRLAVSRIPLDGQRVTVQVASGDVQVTGVAEDVEVITTARSPITAVF